MPEDPIEARVRQLDRELKQINVEEALYLSEFLRKYAGPPAVADEAGRSSIREDSVIQIVAELSAERLDRPFRVLDACCGKGSLARHLVHGLGEAAKRVEYFGIDQNLECIVYARKQRSHCASLSKFECRLGEVSFLPVEWRGTIDVVVLNNTLHEISPYQYPDLFNGLNGLLAVGRGRICVVDMEELPDEEPESVAINWKRAEVEAFLKAAGFDVTATSHPKSVGVLRAIVKHKAEDIDRQAMLAKIKELLNHKLIRKISERHALRESFHSNNDTLMEWLVLTGAIARYAEVLLAVDTALEGLSGEVEAAPLKLNPCNEDEHSEPN